MVRVQAGFYSGWDQVVVVVGIRSVLRLPFRFRLGVKVEGFGLGFIGKSCAAVDKHRSPIQEKMQALRKKSEG